MRKFFRIKWGFGEIFMEKESEKQSYVIDRLCDVSAMGQW
jgi:hypothetical protein